MAGFEPASAHHQQPNSRDRQRIGRQQRARLCRANAITARLAGGLRAWLRALLFAWGGGAAALLALGLAVHRHFGWQTFSVVASQKVPLLAYRLLQWQRATAEWALFFWLLGLAALALDTQKLRADGRAADEAAAYALCALDALAIGPFWIERRG